MLRSDYDISDEDYYKISNPFEECVVRYIKDNFIYDYMAYYISTGYRMDSLWKGSLLGVFNAAIDDLCRIEFGAIADVEKLKCILREKYNLLLTSDVELEIEEIQKEEQ